MYCERGILLVGLLLIWGCPGDKVVSGDSGAAGDSGDSGDSDSGVDADDSGGDDSGGIDDSGPLPVDNDGDGYDSTVDCDDDDASVHPGAEDTWYDGVDMDCSGSDYDADGDGHDSPDYGGDDCDDTSADPPTNTSEVITLGAVPACDNTARISGMLVGESRGDYLQSTSTSGDINGDGIGDILVESGYANEGGLYNNGAVYVVFGAMSGERIVAESEATLYSAASGSAIINANGIGDTNDDGYDDIAILGKFLGGESIYVIDGPVLGNMEMETVDAVLSDGTVALWSVPTAVGDFNGDGYADLLASTSKLVMVGPLSGTYSASDAYLSYGATGPGCISNNSYATGDVDADGLDDIVMVCGAGGAYYFYGGTSGSRDIADADASIEGNFDGASAAGDNNGDGRDDVLLGHVGEYSDYDHSGYEYLFFGPVRDGIATADADSVWYGDTHDDYLAGTDASGVDLNADGFDDVVLLSFDGDYNSAHIMLGPADGVNTQSSADWTLSTSGTGAFLERPGQLGDADADGYQDIGLGAPHHSTHERLDGAVWMLSGGIF